MKLLLPFGPLLVALAFSWGCLASFPTPGTPEAGCLDADGDGFSDAECGGDDCDDTRPEIYPDAWEECDGLDGDCDGAPHYVETTDSDGDGIEYCFDCNPLDAAVGEEEPCPTFWDGIVRSEWEPLPELEGLNLESVVPEPQVPFLELGYRGPFGPESYSSYARRGEPCGDAQDPDGCFEALNALDPWVGFARHCAPGACWNQLYWTRADEVGVVGAETLAVFLGEVSSPEEVALRVAGLDYYWSAARTGSSGIRRVEDGWEAWALHWAGGPGIRTDHVLVHIADDGALTELRRFIESHCWDCDV